MGKTKTTTSSFQSNNNQDNGSRRATSADVARLAGVSRTQVSYVLNKTGIDHVSEDKQQRIMTAARQLNYQPHQSAQALRKGYSNEFGLFFPAPYPARINAMLGTIHESGLAAGCMPTQYSFNSYRDPTRKDAAFQAMVARRPMGIFCSLLDVTRADLEYARAKGIEHILVLDVEAHDDLDTLYMPLEPVGCLAGRHLLELGHQHIGVIRPADPIQARGFRLRLAGLQRAFSDYPDARLSILDWSADNNRPTLEYANELIDRLLSGPDRPSGIYTYSDDYAYPLMASLLDRGIRIPEDISLIGTDDLPHSALVRPSLTSIQMDNVSLGVQAVAMINAMILGESGNASPDVYSDHCPILLPRQSTSRPGRIMTSQ